jgi:hypothetical protein
MIDSQPQFLQGTYPFLGVGYEKLGLLSEKLVYTVPSDKRTQLIYMRAGNSCAEMVCLVLMRGGRPMRYFPIAAKGAQHVPLAVVEDIPPETTLEVFFAAPSGAQGTLVIDIGMLEI